LVNIQGFSLLLNIMNMKLLAYLILFSAAMCFCQPRPLDGNAIVTKSIEVHGGDLYENCIIEFDFRGRHYRLERNSGRYAYHRIFIDSTGTYHDMLNNDGFQRTINDQPVPVTDDWSKRYSNSINSVAYFALLPFGLNDTAVNKNLIGEEEIEGNQYYKVHVTFSQDGGGEDHDDVFVYWINKENFRMEYFGYYYLTDGGGIRFRKAVNQRTEGGMIFSDYVNLKGDDTDSEVTGLARKYKEGSLEKLSEIELENLQVRRWNER
jgi:hypothetical protein